MPSILTVRGDTAFHHRKEKFFAEAAWMRTDSGKEMERDSLILGSNYHNTSQEIGEIDATLIAMMQGLRGLPSEIEHLTLQVNFAGDWALRLIGGQFVVAPFYRDWVEELRTSISKLQFFHPIILNREEIDDILQGSFTFNKEKGI